MSNVASLSFPLGVKWYITSKCNLRCTHCYLTDYTESGDLSRILQIVDFLAGKNVYGIALLGGEPLVREDLEQIVSRITTAGMLPRIATNAVLATTDRAKSLIGAGAKHFQVSIEGTTPVSNDDVRGLGTFGKILSGIESLRSAGASVSVAMTVTKRNYKLIEDLFKFAASVGATGLKLSAFVPVGTGSLLDRDYMLTREIVVEVSQRASTLMSAYPQLHVEAGAFVQRVSVPAPRSRGQTFGCGAGTSMLVINSDFSISACDMLNEVDRTKRRIDRPEDIETLWLHDPLFKKWRGETTHSDLPVIPSFAGVHRNGCHLAYSAYKENLFA